MVSQTNTTTDQHRSLSKYQSILQQYFITLLLKQFIHSYMVEYAFQIVFQFVRLIFLCKVLCCKKLFKNRMDGHIFMDDGLKITHKAHVKIPLLV